MASWTTPPPSKPDYLKFNVLVIPDLPDDTVYFVQNGKIVGKIVGIEPRQGAV